MGEYKKTLKIKTSTKPKKTNKTIRLGESFKIKATQKKPAGIKIKKYKALRYESSNPEIAKVSSKGRITAKKKGKCKIWIYSQNGMIKGLNITVK